MHMHGNCSHANDMFEAVCSVALWECAEALRWHATCRTQRLLDYGNQHSPTQDERKGHAVAPCDILACCHPNNRLDNTDLASVRSPKYGRGVCNVNPAPKATSLLLCSSSHCIQ